MRYGWDTTATTWHRTAEVNGVNRSESLNWNDLSVTPKLQYKNHCGLSSVLIKSPVQWVHSRDLTPSCRQGWIISEAVYWSHLNNLWWWQQHCFFCFVFSVASFIFFFHFLFFLQKPDGAGWVKPRAFLDVTVRCGNPLYFYGDKIKTTQQKANNNNNK